MFLTLQHNLMFSDVTMYPNQTSINSRPVNLLQFTNWPTNTESKERPKKEAGNSRLVGGSFNKQGNLHTGLAFDGCKVNISLHLPTRILKVYIEALTGFGNIFSPDGLNTSSVRGGHQEDVTAD